MFGKADAMPEIQYVGVEGVSWDCVKAVARFLQFGDKITSARLLTAHNVHGLLLTVGAGDIVAVKSGFTSGYPGTGPGALSYILTLLDEHDIPVKDIDVPAALIERLNHCALTAKDLELVEGGRNLWAARGYKYELDVHAEAARQSTLWEKFPAVIPYAIIDRRIIDLAISFWESPDERLMTGYRRLEEIVRKRTGLEEHSYKLFSLAFQGQNSKLTWKDIHESEHNGRGQLITGAYMAYRNPRAHKNMEHSEAELLMEFLLLNTLYRLEGNAEERVQSDSNKGA